MQREKDNSAGEEEALEDDLPPLEQLDEPASAWANIPEHRKAPTSEPLLEGNENKSAETEEG